MPGDSVEKRVRRYYDEEGWTQGVDDSLVDSRNWGRTLPSHLQQARRAIAKTAHLYGAGGRFFLNCGSGPFTDTALRCSKGFERRICIDISTRALALCRDRLGERGVYVCASMLQLGLEDDVADGTLCEHALYHVDKDLQEAAVREMIRVTKPGKPVVILYSNPLAPLNILEDLLRKLGLAKLVGGGKLYFFRHRLDWWRRFADDCDMEVRPFNPISARQAKILLPHDALARLFFGWCDRLERRYPRLATRLWSYPLIVLSKRRAGSADRP